MGDSIYMGVLAMALSFVIVPIVSLFTKSPNNVDDIFSCYDKKVVVPASTVLVEGSSNEPNLKKDSDNNDN